jgi:hypothetical protein
LAAVFGDDLRILFRPGPWGALEQHVLEKMRQTALAILFIARTNPVPNLKGYRRTLVILEKKNLEAIFERELLNIGARVLCGRGEQEESKNQVREQAPHAVTVKEVSFNFKESRKHVPNNCAVVGAEVRCAVSIKVEGTKMILIDRNYRCRILRII